MKRTIEDLAVLNGSPLFDALLHVGTPNLGDRETFLRRVNDILDRRYLTNSGPYEQALERRIAAFVGVRHAVAMCNATVALEIAIRALGMKGEVIVPAFTFVATAHALQWQEITPVFCDIDPATCTLDPLHVEALITSRTTGIIGVHLWGRPCDVEALEGLARRRGLELLFDAAHAFGCSHRGRMIGGFGHAEVFSFHATKFLNSFEGGAVVTDDDELAAKIRLMRNFGFVGYDEVGYIGMNGKMSEIAAAMGLTSLESLRQFVAVNVRNYHLYREGLAGIPGVTLLPYDEREDCNYQYIVLQIDGSKAGLTRDQLQEILRAENVLARRYFYPGCHKMEPYRSSGRVQPPLPHTERLAESVLCLPTGSAVTTANVQEICQLIRWVIARRTDVAERLLDRSRHRQAVVAGGSLS